MKDKGGWCSANPFSPFFNHSLTRSWRGTTWSESGHSSKKKHGGFHPPLHSLSASQVHLRKRHPMGGQNSCSAWQCAVSQFDCPVKMSCQALNLTKYAPKAEAWSPGQPCCSSTKGSNPIMDVHVGARREPRTQHAWHVLHPQNWSLHNRQITHLICVRLNICYMTCWAVFWASFLLFFLYIYKPKISPKHFYTQCLGRTQIRRVI